jgi:hypothetical protein
LFDNNIENQQQNIDNSSYSRSILSPRMSNKPDLPALLVLGSKLWLLPYLVTTRVAKAGAISTGWAKDYCYL